MNDAIRAEACARPQALSHAVVQACSETTDDENGVEGPEEQLQFCEPTYPAPTGSLDEARQKIRDAMVAFQAEAESYFRDPLPKAAE